MKREYSLGFVGLLIFVVVIGAISQLSGGGGRVPVAIMGDLDADQCVTQADYGIAIEIAVGNLAPTSYQMAVGDMNGDGRINSADVALIQREIGECL